MMSGARAPDRRSAARPIAPGSGRLRAAIVGGARGEAQSRWRPLALSLTYVLGLAIVYAALGVVAGLTGTMFGTISTNPWLYFGMANLLVLAGLAMLDVFPAEIENVEEIE